MSDERLELPVWIDHTFRHFPIGQIAFVNAEAIAAIMENDGWCLEPAWSIDQKTGKRTLLEISLVRGSVKRG